MPASASPETTQDPRTSQSPRRAPPRQTCRSGVLRALLLLLCATTGLAATPPDTLVYTTTHIGDTLDPGATYDTDSGGAVENIYETLVTYDHRLSRPAPLLATGWTVSDDGRTYTFDLRPGVKFHSGNAMTCADAEYTIERNLVTNSAQSGNWILAESLLGTGANAATDPTVTWARIDRAAECTGAGQLVLTLPRPDATLPAKLAFVGQSVVDRTHAVAIGEWDGTATTWQNWIGRDLTDSALSRQPSGTGAYRLARRTPGQLDADAFADYWGGPPALAHVTLREVPDVAAQYRDLLAGDTDLIAGGGRFSDGRALSGQPGVTWVDDLPSVVVTGLALNVNIRNPALLGSGALDGQGVPATFFGDADVRRGFSAAFDDAQFIREGLGGAGRARTLLLPERFPGAPTDLNPPPRGPAQAEAYFRRAFDGRLWTTGFTLTLNYRAGSVPWQKAMENLKRNVEALNPRFRITLQARPWNDLSRDVAQGREAAALLSWLPDYADPDTFLTAFYDSRGYYAARSGWQDAQVDRWIAAARETTDAATRSALYTQVARAATEQAPYVVVPVSTGGYGYRGGLRGADAEAFNPMRHFVTGTFWRQLSKP